MGTTAAGMARKGKGREEREREETGRGKKGEVVIRGLYEDRLIDYDQLQSVRTLPADNDDLSV